MSNSKRATTKPKPTDNAAAITESAPEESTERSAFTIDRSRRRRQRKVSELIARDIVDQIIEDDLPSGTRLPTEREMAASMGIGRTTLREALRLLETRGVLVMRAGPAGGPVVSRPQPSDLSEALSLFLQFQKSTLLDLRTARRAIEPMLARLVARNPTKETLKELGECVEQTRLHIDDQQQFLIEATRFHEILAAASGSVVLDVFYHTLTAAVGAAAIEAEYSNDRRLNTLASHEAILDAIMERDEPRTLEAMLEHLEETDSEWMRLNSVEMSRPVRWLL